MNITPWPINTLSSMTTPSQIKEWLDILQFLSYSSILLNLYKRADLGVVSHSTSIEIDELRQPDVLDRPVRLPRCSSSPV